MLEKFRRRCCVVSGKLRYLPKYYFVIPVLIIISSVVIRIVTGGTHIIYNALDGRGIFPGPFLYTILYTLRLVFCSAVLSFFLFSRYIFEDRLKLVFLSSAAVILMLFEYRLIFGGVSLVLAMTFALLCAVLIFLSVIISRHKNKYISILMFMFVVMQIVHFIQLISLAVCI